MDAKDIRFGDIVSYDAIAGLLDGTGELFVIGRAYGRLSAAGATALGYRGDRPYVIRTMYDQSKLNDVSDAIRVDHFDAMSMMPRAELEWGRVPHDGIVAIVGDNDVINAIDDGAERTFRQYGRCPRCGSAGTWKSLALVCDFHGIFL